MKTGYKHNTAIFGTDAEQYISRLFMMTRNPNGSRRPDLISAPKTFDPRLSLEIKSSSSGKGVLVDYQLHYPFTITNDYRDVFGEDLEESLTDDLFSGLVQPKTTHPKIAYYYDIVERSKDIKSHMMNKQFSSIQLDWQNQYIVPHEYGFFGFAVAKSIRTKTSLEKIISGLQKLVKSDIEKTAGSYDHRKDSQSWQNLHGNDILAIFHDDISLTTKDGVNRVRLIRESFPEVDALHRIRLDGPNGTQIYILAKDKHVDLFQNQAKDTILKRTPAIENISLMRRRRRHLLGRSDLKLGTRRQLQKLANWMEPGELPLEIELQKKAVKPFQFHPTYFKS